MAGADRPQDYTPAEATLAEYLDRADRGERIDREQFLAEHPEAAGELRSYLDDLETVHRALGEPTVRTHAGGSRVVRRIEAPSDQPTGPAR